MTEFRGIGECAVASAEHHFIIAVILAGDHEIRNSILIEVRGRYAKLGSDSGQIKGPRELEGTIARAQQDCSGIRSEIGDDQVNIAVVGKAAGRDRRYRSKSGDLARIHQVAPAVAKKLQHRATSVSRDHIELAVSIEVADNQCTAILADEVMRSYADKCAIAFAELHGERELAGALAIRLCRPYDVDNSI